MRVRTNDASAKLNFNYDEEGGDHPLFQDALTRASIRFHETNRPGIFLSLIFNLCTRPINIAFVDVCLYVPFISLLP